MWVSTTVAYFLRQFTEKPSGGMHLAKTMALALLTVLIGAAFFRWGYLPQEEEIARIEAQVAQDKEELVRIQNFMNANMGVSDRTKEMKSRLATAKRRLPEEMDQGGFIALLERTYNSSGSGGGGEFLGEGLGNVHGVPSEWG